MEHPFGPAQQSAEIGALKVLIPQRVEHPFGLEEPKPKAASKPVLIPQRVEHPFGHVPDESTQYAVVLS